MLEIEETADASESDHNTTVAVPEGIVEHCREDDANEQLSHDTALLGSVCLWKGFQCSPEITYTCDHNIMR